MSRSPIGVRSAELADAAFLAELWSALVRKAERQEHVADLEQTIKAAEASPEQRLVVAEYNECPAGAVLLRVGTVTPLNVEPAVEIIAPTVLPEFRRHGIGRTLMECGVAFAEDIGLPHVATGVDSGARDANRYMARLGLAAAVTYRFAPTGAVRARLATPGSSRRRSLVLTARRSMRRNERSDED